MTTVYILGSLWLIAMLIEWFSIPDPYNWGSQYYMPHLKDEEEAKIVNNYEQRKSVLQKAKEQPNTPYYKDPDDCGEDDHKSVVPSKTLNTWQVFGSDTAKLTPTSILKEPYRDEYPIVCVNPWGHLELWTRSGNEWIALVTDHNTVSYASHPHELGRVVLGPL